MEQKVTDLQQDITIIGIGASAGGLEALQDFLAHLPISLSDVAFIVAQHLSPTHKSRLVDLLSKNTSWKVVEAQHGELIKTQIIYITPPDTEIEILRNKIKLSKPLNALRPKPSVDTLFDSLATQQQGRSIGIILSGTGTDGTEGIRAIKKVGGYTIAQEPNTAKFNGMPLSAIESGNVDWVLSPERMGEEIYHLLQDPDNLMVRYNQSEVPNSSLQQIFNILSQRTGTDFSNYKPATILRRLDKRMAALKLKNIDDYLKFLENNPNEVDTLFDTILIGVTSFFRDKEAFETFEKYILKIVQAKQKAEAIRIWVVGCSTGEEAYSIAIIVDKLLKKYEKECVVQIFATDIDDKTIAKARKGIYASQSLEEVPTELIEQYFLKKGDGYELVKPIRNMVLFSKHDITNNPPFLKLDLITCRNLLIYFGTNLQKQIMPVFHYALNPHGYMFLGKSETVGHFSNLFSTIDAKSKVFQQKRSQQGIGIKVTNFKPVKYNLTNTDSTTKKNVTTANSLTDLVKETLYSSLENPYVIVNDVGDILEIHGNIKEFLALQEGAMSTNLIKLAQEGIQIELRAIFTKAVKEKRTFKSRIRKIKINDKENYLRITATPLLFTDKEAEIFMIAFEVLDFTEFEWLLPTNALSMASLQADNHAKLLQDNQRMLDLEHELAVTKEHLQSYIEELETSNEELQSLNEELQSTNEELQSSNEELETSNEELQSTNEEVQITYEELKVSNQELEKTDKLLKISQHNLTALLDNTLNGSCLIDLNYRIVLFNGKLREQLSLLSHKELKKGNFIIDYIPTTNLEAFYKDLSEAVGSKAIPTKEYAFVIDAITYYFLINFTPILDKNNAVEFLSMGVLDISLTKKLYTQLVDSEQFSKSVLDVAAVGICVTDEQGYFVNVNEEYCRIYDYSKEEILGQHFTIVVPELHKQHIAQIYDSFMQTGHEVPTELQVVRKDGRLIDISENATLLRLINGNKLKVTSITDITINKQYKTLLERTQEAAQVGGWYLDLATGYNTWTDEVYQIYDAPPDYVVNMDNGLTCYEEPDRTILANALQEVIDKARSHQLTLGFTSLKGTKKWVNITCSPTIMDGKVVKLYGTIQDVTVRKEAEENLKESQKLYKLLADNSYDVISTLDNDLKLVFVSPSVKLMYGYTPEEFLGLTLQEILTPASLKIMANNRQKRFSLEEENPNQPIYITSEFEQLHKNGDTFWTEVVSTRVYNEKHQSTGYLVVTRDITLRKQHEDELQKLSLVASKTENGIIITNKDRKIEWINEGFSKLSGYTFEEAIGQKPSFLQGAETSQDDIIAIAIGLESKKPFTQDILNYHKDGKKYWINLNITPILSEDGEVEKFIAIQNDITTKKKSEEQLQQYADRQSRLTEDLMQQNNDLRQFSYILSHNIRSYVANILGLVNILDFDKESMEDNVKYLGMLQKSAGGLDNVIIDLNDILDIRKTFNKKIEQVNIEEILEEVVSSLQNQLNECDGGEIIYQIQVKIIAVVKPYFQSVMYNLVSNAIKYNNPKNKLNIKISTEQVAQKVIIKVSDNGLGIDLAVQKENIFSLYKRFHVHKPGKGLGLFMVKTQIEVMGGKIEVESAVNIGSTFTVTLPVEGTLRH